MKNISIHSYINSDELTENLINQLGHDELIDFIKSIDANVADWNFTLELFSVFNDLKEEYENEEGEKK